MFECSDAGIGRHALWLVVGLVACPAVLPGQGIGAQAALRLTARYELELAQPTTGIPVLEGRLVELPFTLRVSPGVGGARPVESVMVCGADGRGCSVFDDIQAPAERSHILHPYAGLAGRPMEIIVCRRAGTGQDFSCAETLASATITIPTYAQYTVSVDNIRVNHTRARTTDTAWLSLMGNVYGQYFHPERCHRGGSLTECSGTKRLGDYRDGTHTVENHQLFVGPFSMPPDQTSTLLFAFGVWNYGFELVSNYGDLDDAFYDAALDAFPRIQPFDVLDITGRMNDHSWHGCDGPTAGAAYRVYGNELHRNTIATGEWLLPATFYSVKSQVGCGASSSYGVTVRIRRTSWHP